MELFNLTSAFASSGTDNSFTNNFSWFDPTILESDPPEYLILPYLPKGEIGILHGDPGSTKSLIALKMGSCIAIGIPFYGHEVKEGKGLVT